MHVPPLYEDTPDMMLSRANDVPHGGVLLLPRPPRERREAYVTLIRGQKMSEEGTE